MKPFKRIMLLCFAVCCNSIINAQSTQTGLGFLGHTAGAGGVPVRYVGWDASIPSNTIPLSIEHRGTNNIIFQTGGVQRMTILGTASGATQGFVGIGTNFIAPLHLIDVRDGDINVGSGTAGNIANSNEAYRIGGNRVLWHNGITTSIFVGVGTGNVGPNNTFVGNFAGAASTGVATARRNTFVGSRAGENCDIGDGNVSVGIEAGNKLSSGDFNTYVGANAATNTASGDRNVAIGHNAMQNAASSNLNTVLGDRAYLTPNTIGTNNVVLGSEANSSQRIGSNNIVIGGRANFGGLQAQLADDNIIIGTNAGAAIAGLNGAVAIGTGATVRGNNRMILGNNINVGIGLGNDNVFNGPRNRLEINTGPQSSDPSLAASGLMFRDLTSVSPVTTNPGPGVLAVDINGNVIYVPGNNSPAIGNNCGATPQNPLTANFEIPMNGFNYTFSDPASLNYGQNTVRVGAACNNPPFTAKFEVFRLPTTFPSGVTSLIGIGSLNRDKYSSPSPGNNAYAGYYVCSGGNAASPSNYANYGIAGYGLNARINYGGYFEAITPFTLNYGVYAKAIQDGSSYAGYFEGDVFINGIGSGTGGVFAPSDSRLKTNIDTISNALAIINQMKPREFYYDTANVYGINFNNKKQYGFIAQDLEPILPELIGYTTKPQVLDTLGNLVTDSLKYKTVNYTAIIGLLTKAIQEQQVKIDSLTQSANTKDSIQDARLTALENAIAQCCSNNNARTNNSSGQAVGNQLNVELSDKDAIVLNQNVPNPFAEQTTITYNVPQNVGKAQLLFYNSNGQLIQSVDIKTRGKGKVNVFASDLSSGLYHYTLVADGKVVDSKKMVRE